MTFDGVVKRIDRYLKKDSISPLVIDVQNKNDLNALVTQFLLPQNTFIAASDEDFCHQDELPEIAALIERVQQGNENLFILEVSSFYRLQGEKALVQILSELLSISVTGHVVFITWQCETCLNKIIQNDPRLEHQICILNGTATAWPKLVFTVQGINIGTSKESIIGINRLAFAIENELADTIYIETSKSKQTYPKSLYTISDMKDPYEVLCQKDPATAQLERSLGTEEDWQYVLSEFEQYPSWDRLIEAKIGNTKSLDSVIYSYKSNKSNKRWLWLYLIGLKLFEAGTNWCLNTAAKKAGSTSEFIRNIYRSILELSPNDPRFVDIYEQRKAILNALDNPGSEVADFCNIVLSKERNAIYYLTDNTEQEKELIFKLMDKYGWEYSKDELFNILKLVYPALYNYLQPYQFKNDLLDNYFQDYKYQKLINKILPEFMSVVEQQAVDRDYNLILQARSAVTEKINRTNAQTYFTDAMGVEYLGYILSKCQELSLLAKVTVCRCELPSITCRNKEFWDLFSSKEYPICSVSDIDGIKHKGKFDCDYRKTKLPIHLMKELEVIDGLLNKIQVDLAQGTYEKAILISDHGASRLAVIYEHETESLVEMEENGMHSGRCCPKSDCDEKPESAADAGDFWALANYDRFKGSRKANVEVHGGATLEEITVPIIEITYLHGGVEIKLMPLNAPANFTGEPEITVGYKKPAAIMIYASQKLSDVSIEIDGNCYPATMRDDHFYVVKEMPEIRRAKTYYVDVFTCGNKIASSLPLRVKKEGISENSIL